jgi:peptidoglycan/xylan/chitin deacetylase (PgdA/CDA1 family)
MYHDVVPDEVHATSGFPGADAALYKISPEEFDRHLRLLSAALPAAPVTVFDLLEGRGTGIPWMMTFDDGGASGYTQIAGRLEARGWRGHFLVATDYIGAPSFVTREQIRELHARGHVIGSHSCSHPLRMSSCSWDRLLREWRDSARVLSDVLGSPVLAGSIPGGQFSMKVAEAAAEAGLKMLFTSEPTMKCWTVNGCLILGRFTIQRWTSAQAAVALASGRLFPRLRQSLLWNAKKITKRLGGEYYLKTRNALIERSPGSAHF